MEKKYAVYIMSNQKNGTLYVGVTNNLLRRVYEHKNKTCGGFSAKYNLNQLVYYELYEDVRTAITREKQLKHGPRLKKVMLIESDNKEWADLYDKII